MDSRCPSDLSSRRISAPNTVAISVQEGWLEYRPNDARCVTNADSTTLVLSLTRRTLHLVRTLYHLMALLVLLTNARIFISIVQSNSRPGSFSQDTHGQRGVVVYAWNRMYSPLALILTYICMYNCTSTGVDNLSATQSTMALSPSFQIKVI